MLGLPPAVLRVTITFITFATECILAFAGWWDGLNGSTSFTPRMGESRIDQYMLPKACCRTAKFSRHDLGKAFSAAPIWCKQAAARCP